MLQEILNAGFIPQQPTRSRRYDANAQKWREIDEPKQWPDQYVHHALVQVLQPVMMRGMDPYCCGSIRGRGSSYARRAIQRWMRRDRKGTRYCLQLDIRHFYQSLTAETVMGRMRQLTKDGRILRLTEAIVRDGVRIGYYTSQWLANTVLQPLDQIIRQSGAARHYVRYMDNFSIFGPNRRKLHRLRKEIEQWLRLRGLQLKGDWQLFPTRKRLPCAVGYRYARHYTLPRKRILLRIKRQTARYRRKMRKKERIPYPLAAGMLARLGMLRHCSNRKIYEALFRGERIQRQLKNIIRAHARKARKETWNTVMRSAGTAERRGTERSRARSGSHDGAEAGRDHGALPADAGSAAL